MSRSVIFSLLIGIKNNIVMIGNYNILVVDVEYYYYIYD